MPHREQQKHQQQRRQGHDQNGQEQGKFKVSGQGTVASLLPSKLIHILFDCNDQRPHTISWYSTVTHLLVATVVLRFNLTCSSPRGWDSWDQIFVCVATVAVVFQAHLRHD